MAKKNKDDNYYFNKIISLGIKADLIEKAGIGSRHFSLLYSNLRRRLKVNTSPRLEITTAWQLSFFAPSRISFEQRFQHRDKNGAGFIHYAAWAGTIEAFQWAKENYPESISAKDKKGLNAASYAALSGEPATLCWLEKHRSDLLHSRNQLGMTPCHFALLSGNAKQFNKALSLSKTPHHLYLIDFAPGKTGEYLDEILNDNFTLTSIAHYDFISRHTKESILYKLQRNQVIQKAIAGFKIYAKNYCPPDEQMNKDRVQTLWREFRIQLPRGIPTPYTRKVFRQIIVSLAPEKRLAFEKKYALGLIKKQMSHLKKKRKIYNGFNFTESERVKFKLLRNLKLDIEHHAESIGDIKKTIVYYCQNYGEVIKHGTNSIHNFFHPNCRPPLKKMFDTLIAIHNISYKDFENSGSAPGALVMK